MQRGRGAAWAPWAGASAVPGTLWCERCGVCSQQGAGASGAGHVCTACCWLGACTVCHGDLWVGGRGGGEEAEPRSVFVQVTDLLLVWWRHVLFLCASVGFCLKQCLKFWEGDCGVPHGVPWHLTVLCSLRTRKGLWDLLLKDNQEQMLGSLGILQCEDLCFASLHSRGVVVFCCFFNLGVLGFFFAAAVVLSVVCFVWNCFLFLFSFNPQL